MLPIRSAARREAVGLLIAVYADVAMAWLLGGSAGLGLGALAWRQGR